MLGILGLLGGSLLGGLISSSGSSKATDTQVNNAGKGIALQDKAYGQAREDLSPWRMAGANALEQLSKALGVDTGSGFQGSPGYKWQFDQGVRAVDAGAANKGLIGSGARAKALTQFGQGVANQDYYNYLNQLGNLSRGGMGAAGGTAEAGISTAKTSAALYGDIGKVKSDNAKEQGNGWGGVLEDIFSLDW